MSNSQAHECVCTSPTACPARADQRRVPGRAAGLAVTAVCSALGVPVVPSEADGSGLRASVAECAAAEERYLADLCSLMMRQSGHPGHALGEIVMRPVFGAGASGPSSSPASSSAVAADVEVPTAPVAPPVPGSLRVRAALPASPSATEDSPVSALSSLEVLVKARLSDSRGCHPCHPLMSPFSASSGIARHPAASRRPCRGRPGQRHSWQPPQGGAEQRRGRAGGPRSAGSAPAQPALADSARLGDRARPSRRWGGSGARQLGRRGAPCDRGATQRCPGR